MSVDPLDTPAFHQQLQRGDPAAFRTLFDEYNEMVYSVCLRMTGNPEDAEDAAQDVFLKIHRSISSFRGDAKLSSWIYRIAVNLCLNRERRKKWARWITLDFLFEPAEEQNILTVDDTEQSLEQEERVQAVRRAIQSLPQSQKTALILQRYEGLSYQDIADILGKSLSAVESLIHRAKQNLVKTLREYENLYK